MAASWGPCPGLHCTNPSLHAGGLLDQGKRRLAQGMCTRLACGRRGISDRPLRRAERCMSHQARGQWAQAGKGGHLEAPAPERASLRPQRPGKWVWPGRAQGLVDGLAGPVHALLQGAALDRRQAALRWLLRRRRGAAGALVLEPAAPGGCPRQAVRLLLRLPAQVGRTALCSLLRHAWARSQQAAR